MLALYVAFAANDSYAQWGVAGVLLIPLGIVGQYLMSELKKERARNDVVSDKVMADFVPALTRAIEVVKETRAELAEREQAAKLAVELERTKAALIQAQARIQALEERR